MEPALALQSAIRTVLVGASAVIALVPAASILDFNRRPDVMPVILLGEGQTVQDEGLARDRYQVYLDLHIWAQELGTVVIKQIMGAIRGALADTPWSILGLEVADLHITSARFLRDPDTVHSHAIVTLNCRVRELAS